LRWSHFTFTFIIIKSRRDKHNKTKSIKFCSRDMKFRNFQFIYLKEMKLWPLNYLKKNSQILLITTNIFHATNISMLLILYLSLGD